MNLKKTVIWISIALIFALFVGYGIEVFNPSYKYEDFCPREAFTEEECLEEGGMWQGFNEAEVSPKRGFCQPPINCSENYNLAQSKHDKIVFIVSVIVGILAVITGFILKKDVVNQGILVGGILLIIYGTLRYWRYANNILKFVLLGLVLGVLIWIAYKKLGKS